MYNHWGTLAISVLCTYQKFVVEAPYLRWTLVKVRVTFVFFSLMFLYLFYMFFAKPLIISLYLLDLWKKNFTIYIERLETGFEIKSNQILENQNEIELH